VFDTIPPPDDRVEPLFRPFALKSLRLSNRVVMAPISRNRASRRGMLPGVRAVLDFLADVLREVALEIDYTRPARPPSAPTDRAGAWRAGKRTFRTSAMSHRRASEEASPSH